MNTNIILLKALLEPEYSRIEFWKQKQKESSFSEIVYWKKLNNSLDFYFDKINDEIERRNEMFLKAGKEPQYSNFGLSLFNETNGELNAEFSLDNSVLIELRNKLLEWAEEIKPFIYYYNYTPNNVIIANYSLLKHFEFLKNLNIVSFNYELRNKPAEQINEFLDFHLRNFKRQYEKLSNWNELLAEWFSYTKKQMPATFTPHQKDNFLIWFESKNEIPNEKTNIEAQPTSFDELVHNEYSIQPFIDILKEVEPPLIDADCNYIGKNKGALVVWIEEMFRQAIIKKSNNSDKVFSSLLPQKIIGLTISDSTFRKGRKNAEMNYKEDFKTLISKEKLSQISHKGKLGK